MVFWIFLCVVGRGAWNFICFIHDYSLLILNASSSACACVSFQYFLLFQSKRKSLLAVKIACVCGVLVASAYMKVRIQGSETKNFLCWILHCLTSWIRISCFDSHRILFQVSNYQLTWAGLWCAVRQSIWNFAERKNCVKWNATRWTPRLGTHTVHVQPLCITVHVWFKHQLPNRARLIYISGAIECKAKKMLFKLGFFITRSFMFTTRPRQHK